MARWKCSSAVGELLSRTRTGQPGTGGSRSTERYGFTLGNLRGRSGNHGPDINNIISGDDINTFSPDKALSRQDLYGVLYNYARYRNVLPGNAVELDGFLDVGNVPYYDIYPLQWAVGNGLLGGDGGRLYPNSFTTRAQVAQIMTVFKEKAGL